MVYVKPRPGDPMVFPAVQNSARLLNLGHGAIGQRRVGYHGNKVDPTYYLRLTWRSEFQSNKGNPPAPNTAARYYSDYREVSDSDLVSASNAALAKVDDQLRVVNSYWEDWYERQQAYSLLVSSAKKLLKFLRNYKKPSYWKKLKRDHASLATMPEAWLAYNFGIKPLVGTISRSLDVMGADFPVEHIDGSSGFTVKSEYMTQLVAASYRKGATVYMTHTGVLKYGCRVTGVNPNSALRGAVGLDEPFSSAWAVIPWGWAVDYFFNASQLVSNLENKHPGIKVTGWYRTLSYKSDFHVASPGSSTGWGRWSCLGSRDYVLRKPISSPAYQPELSFPLLGSGQAANLLSAIALTMKGKK